MSSARSGEIETLTQLADVVASAAVFLAGVAALGPAFGRGIDASALLPLGLVASLVWPFARWLVDLALGPARPGVRARATRLGGAGVVAAAAQVATSFATGAPVPLLFPVACAAAQLAVLTPLHVGLVLTLRWLRRRTRGPRNVLIAGSGPRAAYVERVIERNPDWGLHVLGFIDGGTPAGGPCVDKERVFELSHMRELLMDQVIDEVIVACPRSLLEAVVPVVDAATEAGVPITLLSDLFGDHLPAPQVRRFGSLPALRFAPVHHSSASLAVKRGIDILGAGLGLLLAAPILAAAALAIRLSSRGPVLFRQVRCTLNGRHFVMPKLRTMSADAESRRAALETLNEMDGPVFKMRRDPRVTRVGRLLRRYSLDELPQLWSVLRGDMSLVGPRPPVPTEVAAYETFERRRLSMRPGLTCLWQVSGRNEIGFDDWVRLDLEYIDTWSLALDLRILARTVPAVLRGTGAS